MTHPQKKTLGIAVTSLVLGLLSYLCLGPLTSIPAVICGHMGLSQIKRNPAQLGGEGMALAGLIMGYINLVLSLFLIPLMMAIAVPSFHQARESAQRNACINNLRQIDSAKDIWAIENRRFEGDVPTVLEITPYLMREQLPLCPKGGTYTIGPVGEPPTCSIPGHELAPFLY